MEFVFNVKHIQKPKMETHIAQQMFAQEISKLTFMAYALNVLNSQKFLQIKDHAKFHNVLEEKFLKVMVLADNAYSTQNLILKKEIASVKHVVVIPG